MLNEDVERKKNLMEHNSRNNITRNKISKYKQYEIDIPKRTSFV